MAISIVSGVREPAFHPFTSQHWAAFALGCALVTLFLILGRRGGVTERRSRVLLALLNFCAFPFSFFGRWIATQGHDLNNFLPLHLCNVATFVAGFALLTRKPLLITLTYFWGLAGTIQGVLTPELDIGFPHPVAWSFFLLHFAVIGAALYFPVVLGWRVASPVWKSPLTAFLWLNAYAAMAAIANLIFHTNFAFLREKPGTASLLDLMGPWPWYILSLQGLALTFLAFLTLPVLPRKSKIIS